VQGGKKAKVVVINRESKEKRTKTEVWVRSTEKGGGLKKEKNNVRGPPKREVTSPIPKEGGSDISTRWRRNAAQRKNE